jgi:hypothetical protein
MDDVPASSHHQGCDSTGEDNYGGLGSPSAASSAALVPSTST